MAERDVLDEDRIQDYIDDRLDERDRANVAAYLLANPEIGAEVEKLRRQNEALKLVGREILEEPVPERLRSALRPPPEAENVVPLERIRPLPRFHFLEAAAAVLLFVVGVASGWVGNNALNPAPSEDDLAIAGVARAFADFGVDRDFPIEFPPDRKLELASWINKSFEHEVDPPDLEQLDYRYIGGRLMPGINGKIGSFMFEDIQGTRLAVFFWPRAAPPKKVIELSRQDSVETRFWFGDGFGFAVVGNNDNVGIDKVADSVFEHYERKKPFAN